MSTYFVTLEIEVTDERELLKAAQKQAAREGSEYTLEEGGEIDVPTCLRVLADPGESWPGTQIIDSTCE